MSLLLSYRSLTALSLLMDRLLKHGSNFSVLLKVQDLKLRVVISIVDVLVDGHSVVVLSLRLDINLALGEVE